LYRIALRSTKAAFHANYFPVIPHFRFDTAAEQATGMWYGEVEKYKFEKPSFQPGTGHFTQVGNQRVSEIKTV
jgi:hypothetical protein